MFNNPDQDLIYGRHPVKEALQAGPVAKILVANGIQGDIIDEILSLAKEKKIKFSWIDKRKLDELTRRANHQGVVAYIAPLEYANYGELLDEAIKKKKTGVSLVFLDGIQDPHNLGAVIRSAVYFGVIGVVIPKWRSASLTGAVMRASSGAASYISISQVTNLATALEEAKQEGLWLVGADMDGMDVKSVDVATPFGLVMGAEDSGLHRLVREKCDYVVSIKGVEPRQGIDSLNVGVAAGILFQHFS